jgi:hypothetical protein
MTTRLKLLVAVLAASVVPTLTTGQALAGTIQVKGVFHIASGSYIRMQLPSGGYFDNPYSALSNKTYTAVASSASGGISTASAQPAPNPAFDSHGNSLASSIIRPTSFTGIKFGVTTTVVPSFYVSGSKLTAYIRHLYAQWNKQTFLQGAIAFGTYNSRTHAYSLTWQAVVHGGPFDGYTGHWHLQGTFTPS